MIATPICENCLYDGRSAKEWPCINCVNNVDNHFEPKGNEVKISARDLILTLQEWRLEALESEKKGIGLKEPVVLLHVIEMIKKKATHEEIKQRIERGMVE